MTSVMKIIDQRMKKFTVYTSETPSQPSIIYLELSKVKLNPLAATPMKSSLAKSQSVIV